MDEGVTDSITAFECGLCHKLYPFVWTPGYPHAPEPEAFFKWLDHWRFSLMCQKCTEKNK